MSNPTSPSDLLLMPDVAAITKRSIDTLRYLRARGEGPRSFKHGRRVYYRRSAVEEWIREQERAADEAAAERVAAG